MDKFVLVWDIRKPNEPVIELARSIKTHQRFKFDLIDDNFLVSGDHEGYLDIFDIEKDEIVFNEQLGSAPLVSVDVKHGWMVAGSGCRQWDHFGNHSDTDEDMMTGQTGRGKLSVYSISSL